MSSWLAYVILRFRLVIFLVFAGVTLALLPGIRSLKLSSGSGMSLPVNNEEAEFHQRFSAAFQSREVVILGCRFKQIPSPVQIHNLEMLSQRLSGIQGVSTVYSKFAGAGGGDELNIGATIKSEGAGGGRFMIFQILLEPDFQIADYADILTALDEQVAISDLSDVETFISGKPALIRDFQSAMMRDAKCLMWATPLLMMIFLYAVFRSWSSIIIPMASVFLAVSWSLAFLAFMQKPVSMIMIILPTLIMVISVSDLIHFLSHYYDNADKHSSPKSLVQETTAYMLTPCLLTTLTTALGFGSLFLSNIDELRYFGLTAAVGLLSAYIFNMTVVPGLLSILPLPKKRVLRFSFPGITQIGLKSVVRAAHRPATLVLVLTLMVSAASLYGMSRIRFETQLSSLLPADAPSVQAIQILEDELSSFSRIELALEGPPGAFEDLEAIHVLDKATEYASNHALSIQSFSLSSMIRQIHAHYEKIPIIEALPLDQNEVYEYLDIFSLDADDLLASFINEEHSLARISVSIRSSSTLEQLNMMHDLERDINAILPEGYLLRATGGAKLLALGTTALSQSLLLSFVFTAVIILALLSIYLKSCWAGFIGLIPNIIPALIIFGYMGLLNIPVDASTVMIACIAIGIAVDDSIHLLVSYIRKDQASGYESAIEGALFDSGGPILFTTLVIAGGFLILLLSSLRPNRIFGGLMALTMVVALIIDFWVFPHLLKWMPNRIHKKNRL